MRGICRIQVIQRSGFEIFRMQANDEFSAPYHCLWVFERIIIVSTKKEGVRDAIR